MRLLQELYTAIETENEEEVELILRINKNHDDFNLNQILRPRYDMTPLHLAVGLNSASIVTSLLANGADPNCLTCSETISPLHLSVLYDLEFMVKILMRSGGDPNILDGEKKSCFDLAFENDIMHMVEFLTVRNPEPDNVNVIVEKKEAESEPVKKIQVSTIGSPALPYHQKVFESYTESYFTCNSISKSSTESLSSTVTTANEDDKESGRHSVTTASSGDIWLPSCSYQMTDDESTSTDTNTTCECDADKSSDTTIVDELSPSSTTATATSLITPRLTVLPSTTVKVPTPDEIENLTEAVKDLGIKVPITLSTYPVLTNRVENIGNGSQHHKSTPVLTKILEQNRNSPGFSTELQASLINLDLIQIWGNLKIDLIQSLTPTRRTSKSFYNYLLLDPKIIKRANFSGNHLKSDIIKNGEKFERFLSAVFYVGKGCGNRPISHLVDAKAKLPTLKKNVAAGTSEKLSKILQIWKAGQGVILHSVFHHSAEREANINEAAMIDAIGINCNQELTNVKKGSYLGTGAVQWTQKMRNQFGSLLLYKCFCSFVVSDAKVFFPHDV